MPARWETPGRPRLLLALAGRGMNRDGVVQVFTWGELHALAGRNVDLLASLRVDANAGGSVFDREHAKPNQADRVTGLQGLADGLKGAIDEDCALLDALVRLGCYALDQFLATYWHVRCSFGASAPNIGAQSPLRRTGFVPGYTPV